MFADDRGGTSLPSAIVPLGGALALGCLQLLPLDENVQQLLSPRGAELKQFLASEPMPVDAPLVGRLGLAPVATRQPASLYPASTRNDLALLVLATGTFLVGAALFRTPGAQTWLFGALAINGAALALFGIVQRLTFNGQIYWRVPLTQGGVPFGPFVNKNNAAAFLMLCLGGALGLLIKRLRRSGWLPDAVAAAEQTTGSPSKRRRWPGVSEFLTRLDVGTLAAFVLTGCITAGIFCSLSRSAAVATVGAAVATVIVLRLTGRWNARLGWIGLAAAAGLALVGWVGMSGSLRARLGTLVDYTALSAEAKLPHWQQVVHAVPDFWRTGSGLGTYRFVYGLYDSRPTDLWFYHAENHYLEALVEGGALGLGLLLCAIGWMGCAGWRLLQAKARGRTLAAGSVAIFVVTGQALHGLFDYSLYIPANMLLMALLAGALAGRAADVASQHGWSRYLVLSRPAGLSTILAMAALVGVLWGGREISRVAETEASLAAAEACFRRAGQTADTLAEATQRLADAAESCPDDAQTHCQLAKFWIRRYQAAVSPDPTRPLLPSVNPAELPEVALLTRWHAAACQLALGNQREALQQLRDDSRVRQELGPALRHLLLSRRACPLFPEVHLLIGELAVLVGDPAEQQLDIRRAQRTAPGQPQVFFQGGLLEWQARQADEALDSWRQCLLLSEAYLPRILELAAAVLPQAGTIERLFPAQPQLLIKLACEVYAAEKDAEVKKALIQRAAALVREGRFPEDETHYLQGAVCALQGDYPQAISHTTRAVELRPDAIRWRYELAVLLQHDGRLEEAHASVQGCLLSDPQNNDYRALLDRLNQQRTRSNVTDRL